MRVRILTLGLAACLVGLALADPAEACHGRRRRGRCGGHSAVVGGYWSAGACGGYAPAGYGYGHPYAASPGYAAPMMTQTTASGQAATSQSYFGQAAAPAPAPASSIAPPAPEVPPAPEPPTSNEAPRPDSGAPPEP